jgi:hypothetical protein
LQDKGGRGGAGLPEVYALAVKGNEQGKAAGAMSLRGHRDVSAGMPYSNWNYMSAMS